MAIPKVSVLMPAYNHANYVATAIESVLNQTLNDLELIIIDDASTDNTWSLLRQYAENPRVRLYQHAQNQGAHSTLNEALGYARSNHIAIINSDDLFTPDRLAACCKRLDEGADMVGTDIQLIDSSSSKVEVHWWIDAFTALKEVYVSTSDWPTALLAGNMFMTTSNFVFKRSIFERVGLFNDFRYVLDYDYLLRVLAAGQQLAWIDDALLKYRLHESNTISDSPLKANRECAALLRTMAAKVLKQPIDPLFPQRWQALSKQLSQTEQYIVEILLAQQHHRLVEQEENWQHDLQTRDKWISDRDAWIEERDERIKERDVWISARDEQIKQRDVCINARDEQIKQRDVCINARDEQIKQRDNLLALYRKRFDPLLAIIGWRGAALLEYPARTLRELTQLFKNPRTKVRRLFSLDHKLVKVPIRLTSYPALQHWIEHRSGDLHCVSFDVFDTLLARCIEPPEWLHRRVAEQVADYLGNSWQADAVLALRHQEEQALRDLRLASGDDHECHYDPLIKGWAVRLSGTEDQELIAFIQKTEHELERLALYVKPGARELLQYLHQRHVSVIAVSDMYFGHTHIRQMLNDCGLQDLIDRIYVSADFGLAKYSGRLHAKVLEAEGLTPEQMIHIGDNLVSDMLSPCSLGIQGVFLDERSERLRRRHQKLSAQMASRGGIWPGRMLNEIVAERLKHQSKEVQQHQDYFNLGLAVLGPLFATFTLGLIERLARTKPERIYFLARDGYIFKALYQQYRQDTAQAEELPEPDYLYVSRRVLSSASVASGLTLEQARVAFYNPKQQGLLSICKAYGLDPDEFAELAKEHGMPVMWAPITDWNDPRLLAFLADERVQGPIRKCGTSARQLLKDYLSQSGFFTSARVAFVDIGWNGTIQKFLVEAFSDEPGFPELHGYYYALGTAMHGDFAHGGSIEGLLMDTRNGNPCERAPADFEELFEQGARALEATTLGYRKVGQVIEPILKSDDAPDRQAELACNPWISAMQEGIQHYFTHFLAAQKLTGFSFTQLRPYALGITEQAVVYPDRNAVSLLGQLSHTEDFGHDEVLDLKASPLRLKDFFHPRALYQRIQGLPWRYAPFATIGSPWTAWIVRIMHLKRVEAKNE